MVIENELGDQGSQHQNESINHSGWLFRNLEQQDGPLLSRCPSGSVCCQYSFCGWFLWCWLFCFAGSCCSWPTHGSLTPPTCQSTISTHSTPSLLKIPGLDMRSAASIYRTRVAARLVVHFWQPAIREALASTLRQHRVRQSRSVMSSFLNLERQILELQIIVGP